MSHTLATRVTRMAAYAAALTSLRPLVGTAEAQAPTTRKPFATFSASASSMRDSLVQLARAQVGRRYRMGGQSPDRGFDCSGLVRYVMTALSVEVPRTASQQDRAGIELVRDTSMLRPGDLLTFGKGRGASHVGIYVGNGRYVHASSKAGRVIESRLDRPANPLIKTWRGARRMVATPDSSMMAIQPGS